MHLRALLLLPSLGLAACSSPFTLGPDGGTLELPGGASLVVPAGALSEDVTIVPTLLTDLQADGWAGLPEFVGAPRLALSLEPHGLSFAEPVTLSIPHAGLADGLTILRSDEPDDPRWESAGLIERGDEAVSLSLSGFSGYALTEVQNGACPCFDPVDALDYQRQAAQSNWTRWSFTEADRRSISYAQGPDGVHLLAAIYPNSATCGAYADGDQGGPAVPGLLPQWMPGIPEQDFPTGTGVSMSVQPEEARACIALLATMFEGEPGSSVQVSPVGVPTGSGVGLDASFGGRWNLGDAVATRLFPLGEPSTLSIATVPSGVACTFGGGAGATVAPDGQSATFTPGGDLVELTLVCAAAAIEDPCNGIDDDGDGQIDETASTTDTDGDGLVDECDSAPNLGCVCFTLGEVQDWFSAHPAAAWQTAQAFPEFTFEGFTEAGTGDEVHLAGVASAPGSSDECALGCFDQVASGACAGETLVYEAIEPAEREACLEVARAAVPQ